MQFVIEVKNIYGWFAYTYAGSMRDAIKLMNECKLSGAIDSRITPIIEFFKRVQTNI